MLWDIWQQKQLNDLDTKSTDTSIDIKGLYEKNKQLEERVDKLSMISRALWSFLQEDHNLKEEDLIKRITKIDMADGKLDGKVEHVIKCKECGRAITQRFNKCMFCGAKHVNDSDAFNRV